MGKFERAAFAAGYLVGAGEVTLPKCKLPKHIISIHRNMYDLGKEMGKEQKILAITTGGQKIFRERIEKDKAFLESLASGSELGP